MTVNAVHHITITINNHNPYVYHQWIPNVCTDPINVALRVDRAIWGLLDGDQSKANPPTICPPPLLGRFKYFYF